VAARLAQRDQEDVHSKRKLRGRREGTVLDPCRLALDFTLAAGSGPGTPCPLACSLLACSALSVACWHLLAVHCTARSIVRSVCFEWSNNPPPGAEGSGAGSRTDIKLEASDLRLTLSPDVLELGSLLAASALEPLMQVWPAVWLLYPCFTAASAVHPSPWGGENWGDASHCLLACLAYQLACFLPYFRCCSPSQTSRWPPATSLSGCGASTPQPFWPSRRAVSWQSAWR
jgi:hypothetical protein